MRLDSPFFQFITNAGNLIFASILWFIGCIPIVTICSSTAALYYTCTKTIRYGRGYILSCFLHSYRENLRQGCVITLLYLLVGAVLYTDYFYLSHLTLPPAAPVLMYRSGLAFFACLLLYLTTNLSRFRMPIFELLKLSFFMMIRHFYLTFVMSVLLIASVILTLSIPMAFFFLPGLYMLLKSIIMEKILKKYMPHPENEPEDGAWYFDD